MLVETRVGRLYVEVVGKGPEVVLWHSLLCDGGMWREQVDALSDRFRFVNVDGPGHGRSAPMRRGFSLDDCVTAGVQVMDAVGVERAAWCGLSWGGMVGMRLAVQHPDRLAALVLMDTSARRERAAKRPGYLVLATIACTIGPVRPLGRVLAPIFFSDRARRDQPELVERVVSELSRMDPASIAHAADAVVFDRDDVSDRLSTIEAPTLVVVGEDDGATPPAEARLLAERIPRAELLTVPDASHLSALERPDLVNDALGAFLERHVTRT